MTRVRSAEPDELRVIICLAFDHRAPPGEIAQFKSSIVSNPFVMHAVELTGTFDFMIEAGFLNLAAYQKQLASWAEPLASLVTRYEANFVCKTFVCEHSIESEIWVPSHQGLQRVDCTKIDMVRAEGDYMRIFSEHRSWLLHTTLAKLKAKLDPDEFLTVHRSVLLRRGFIERLRHEGSRWFARLQTGEEVGIAKSQVKAVLHALRMPTGPMREGAQEDACLSMESSRPRSTSIVPSLDPIHLNVLALAEHHP